MIIRPCVAPFGRNLPPWPARCASNSRAPSITSLPEVTGAKISSSMTRTGSVCCRSWRRTTRASVVGGRRGDPGNDLEQGGLARAARPKLPSAPPERWCSATPAGRRRHPNRHIDLRPSILRYCDLDGSLTELDTADDVKRATFQTFCDPTRPMVSCIRAADYPRHATVRRYPRLAARPQGAVRRPRVPEQHPHGRVYGRLSRLLGRSDNLPYIVRRSLLG